MMKYPSEIRAEVLINYMLANQPDIKANKVLYQGVFRRNYLNDILKVEHKEIVGDDGELNYYLNRDGFYDKLPEGLFHPYDRFVNLSSKHSGKQFSEEYEKQKKEIDFSRKFFFPFENELFAVNLRIDKLLNDWTENPISYLFGLFFGEESTSKISIVHRKRIIPFLPSFSSIRGDIRKLTFFMIAVMQTEVEIRQMECLKTTPIQMKEISNVIGDVSLNNGFVCGEEFTDLCVEWAFRISATNEMLSEYIEKTHITSLLNFVKEFFVPAGVESSVTMQVYQMNNFLLPGITVTGPEKKQYLGYNILI